jgi:hypothetical protein
VTLFNDKDDESAEAKAEAEKHEPVLDHPFLDRIMAIVVGAILVSAVIVTIVLFLRIYLSSSHFHVGRGSINFLLVLLIIGILVVLYLAHKYTSFRITKTKLTRRKFVIALLLVLGLIYWIHPTFRTVKTRIVTIASVKVLNGYTGEHNVYVVMTSCGEYKLVNPRFGTSQQLTSAEAASKIVPGEHLLIKFWGMRFTSLGRYKILRLPGIHEVAAVPTGSKGSCPSG